MLSTRTAGMSSPIPITKDAILDATMSTRGTELGGGGSVQPLLPLIVRWSRWSSQDANYREEAEKG